MTTETPAITIPTELLPRDGRFGSGPSKVRTEAVRRLAEAAPAYLGTSHRREGVRSVVRRVREGMATLFALPEGYEVVLGNGGAAYFWDVAACSLIDARSQHLVFGEFSSSWAAAVATAPHLREPVVIRSEPGTRPEPRPDPEVDAYALTQNETSTGVAAPVARPGEGLVLVDATSSAGGMRVEPHAFDVYFFSPQKCFAADAGLWIALCSPAAIERAAAIAGRWIPSSLSFTAALESSRKDQTLNTPPLAALFLLADTVDWMLGNGGLEWAAARCERSADILYGWAERTAYTTPFVADPAHRSPVVGTVDFTDDVDAAALARVLRANGILDVEPYRKLERNQLRIALFPAVDPEDVERLTGAFDHVVAALA